MNITSQIDIEGVQTIVPPPEFKTSIDNAIKKFVEDGEARDGIYSMATFNNGKIGVNLVVVKNVGKSVKIEGYIGKTWGQPIEGGVRGVWYFD